MLKYFFVTLSIILFSMNSYSEDKVIATINNKPVLESQIRKKVNDFLEINGSIDDTNNYETLDPKSREGVIRSIILGDLVTKEAINKKINQTEQYIKSLKMAQDQLLQKIYIEDMVRKAITEDVVKNEYKKIVQEYNDKFEYKVSHILVESEDQAHNIIDKLKKGEKFEDIARNQSIDPSKSDGGSLDYFAKGQMVEPFEEAVLKMNLNEISAPVKTEFGYHVIKLEDKRKAQVPSYDELKGKISEDLATNYVENYLIELENKYKVKFINND